MSNTFDQEKIMAGRDWAEEELRHLAIERTVKVHAIIWTESVESQVWIATINSVAGEHTMALSYASLAQCANDENARLPMREKLRNLIGDLARIERRGYLR